MIFRCSEVHFERHSSSVLIQKYRSELYKSGGVLPPCPPAPTPLIMHILVDHHSALTPTAYLCLFLHALFIIIVSRGLWFHNIFFAHPRPHFFFFFIIIPSLVPRPLPVFQCYYV